MCALPDEIRNPDPTKESMMAPSPRVIKNLLANPLVIKLIAVRSQMETQLLDYRPCL